MRVAIIHHRYAPRGGMESYLTALVGGPFLRDVVPAASIPAQGQVEISGSSPSRAAATGSGTLVTFSFMLGAMNSNAAEPSLPVTICSVESAPPDVGVPLSDNRNSCPLIGFC